MASAIQQIPSSKSMDRRAAYRYPVEADLEYRVMHRGKLVASGHGRTINISNSGILFESSGTLIARFRIELSISWPARLKNGAPVTMHVIGRSVRTQNHLTAIEIIHHKFKSAG
jgi:hypothetical protein